MSVVTYSRRSTEVVAELGIFRVERHRVVASGGTDESDCFTIEASDWVAVVALTAELEVVLVRQHRHGTQSVTLETPGGIVDPFETPDAAASRELLEETGFDAATLESLGWVHPNPALQSNRCYLYLAHGAVRVGDPRPDAGESTEPVLLGRAAVRAALGDGRISHALAALALERGLARLDDRHRDQNPSRSAGNRVD